MSDISGVLSAYRKALQNSQKRYESLFKEKAKNTEQFYWEFLKKLIRHHEEEPSLVADAVRKILGKETIRFVAIDGHPYKDQLSDFAIFFAVACGIRGEIVLGANPTVKYTSKGLFGDISMVAYVPIPFAELDDVLISQDTENVVVASTPSSAVFAASDEDRINLGNLHLKLMTLAEIYVAYKEASSEQPPDLILWDQSISLMYQWVTHQVEKIPIVRNRYKLMGSHDEFDGREIKLGDAYVALAHPFNATLDVPAATLGGKYFALQRRFIYKLITSPDGIPLESLAVDSQVSVEEAKRIVDRFLIPNCIASMKGNLVQMTPDTTRSWRFILRLFELFCSRLFEQKDETALIYETEVQDGASMIRRGKWVGPEDLDLLIGVGLRRVMELCWEKRLLFIGIVKDSQQRYFTRNYIGVMGYLKTYSYAPRDLPWTDRVTLELLPAYDKSLKAPWSTVDYDSTYVTVHLYSQDGKIFRISGGPGDLTAPEHMVARCLAQFYIREQPSLLCSHILFIDRLLLPEIDADNCNRYEISTQETFGTIRPFADLWGQDINKGQEAVIGALYLLCRNRYPEVVGYPEPLHLADWAAKTYSQKWAQKMIRSSGTLIKTRPLARTFREVRDSLGR